MVFLKYPGGKQSELPIIKKYLPKKFSRYYEPFVGGGAVYFNTDSKKYFINDKSNDLILLYNSIKKQDEIFFDSIINIDKSWKKITDFSNKKVDELKKIYSLYKDGVLTTEEIEYMSFGFIDKNSDKLLKIIDHKIFIEKDIFIEETKKYLSRKLKDMKKLSETKNFPEEDIPSCFEGVFKGSLYMYLRTLYNKTIHNKKVFEKGETAALYLFIRETTYSAMFRFNANGDFNVPYGGITYNNKSFTERINLYKSEDIKNKLQKTSIKSLDFYDFMQKYPPTKKDFIFLDPPYDSEFSAYDQSEFDKNDQTRLANYLINECDGMFMVVIKNTDFISSLYKKGTETKNGGKIDIIGFDKKYAVSFMNRNNKDCEHLIITNYKITEE